MIKKLENGVSTSRGLAAINGDGKVDADSREIETDSLQTNDGIIWSRANGSGTGASHAGQQNRALFLACPDPTNLASALVNAVVRPK